MWNTRVRLVVLSMLLVGASIPVRAQGRGGPPPWTTSGADAQRTAAVRTDPKIDKDSVQKAFAFLWKRSLEDQPRQLDALTQPVLLPNIISYKGFKALAFVGAAGDTVYALDYDLSKIFWQRRLETGIAPQNASVECSGALTTVTRATTLTPSAGGRGGRQGGAIQPPPGAAGTPAAAAAGVPPAPGAAVVGGAPDPRLASAAGRGAPPPPPAADANPPRPGSGPGPNAALGGYAASRGGNPNVYAISSGGALHALNPQDGTDMVPPIPFLPPRARAVGSVLLDSVLYTATTGACGGAPNGVWAIELANNANTVTKWETRAPIAGDGPAFAADGTVFVATGSSGASAADANAIVALEPKTLTMKGSFSAAKTPFTTSPIVFTSAGRTLVAAGNKDGRVYIVDASALAAGRQSTPLAASDPLGDARATITGLATADDGSGGRWIFASVAGAARGGEAATHGAVVALQLASQDSGPALRVGWTSRDLTSAVTPAIVNGVVFALASGEDRGGGSAAERAKRSTPAVLYALDAATGKELWSSGSTIASFVHDVGPSAGDSQVYVVTYDGTVWAFGIPMER